MKRALAAVTVALLAVAGVLITPSAAFAVGAAADDSYVVAEDGEITANVNDNDVQFGVLEMITSAEHGIVHFTDTGAFSYYPDPDFTGTDSFTYQFMFGPYGVATATFTVTPVYDPPAPVDDTATVNADGSYYSPVSVLANDVHIDDTAISVDGVGTYPAHGDLTLFAEGDYFYFPYPGYVGADEFTYRVLAQNGTYVYGTVRLIVNDAPIAVDDFLSTDEDTPLVFSAAALLSNDIDQAGGPLVVDLVGGESTGSLQANSDGVSFTYTPQANFTGIATFEYYVTDGSRSAWGTVSVDVLPVDDAPVLANDSYSVGENDSLTVTAANGVLLNDSDADGDSISAVFSSALNPDGILSGNSDGSFTFVPTTDFWGTTTFTYWIAGYPATTATITFTVVSSNHAPTIVLEVQFPTEDTAFEGSVLPAVYDADGDPVTVALDVPTMHGSVTLQPNGDYTYVPDADFSGQDYFSFTAFDGESYSASDFIYLFVYAVNDAPIAVTDSVSTPMGVPVDIMPLANDYDVDGTLQTAFNGGGDAQHGSVTQSGTAFTYTPDAYFHGIDSFTYTIYDNSGGSSTGTVTVTVTGANIAPTAGAVLQGIYEDTSVAGNLLSETDDLDHFPNATLTTSLATPPTNGIATVSANGDYSYVPNAGWFGVDSFSYQVSDGDLTATATVTVTVLAVNDGPIDIADSFTGTEDSTLVASLSVIANDTDPENQTMTAVLDGAPARGALSFNADGTFTYQPEPNFFGTDSFIYHSVDSTGAAGNVVVVQLTITGTNDEPTAEADSFAGTEDVTLSVAAPGLLANDIELDGETLTVTIVDQPQHGTLTALADGSFTYVPDANWSGIDGFSYRANDALGSALAAVTLTIAAADETSAALASTGSDAGSALMAALLLLAGGAWMAVRRRRALALR